MTERNLTPPAVVSDAPPQTPSFGRELAAAAAVLALTGLNAGLAAPSTVPSGPVVSHAASTPSNATSAVGATATAAAIVGEQQVYLGNLHSHTSYSDGSGTPKEAFKHARDAGLDFMAVTEHNHAAADGTGDRKDGVLIATSPDLYDSDDPASLRRSAETATKDGKFVALFGQEFSTISTGNHVNVFDVRGVIDAPNGDFRALTKSWLPQHLDSSGSPALLQFNHPESPSEQPAEYGKDDFADEADWIRTMDAHAELIEVFNGPGLKNEVGLTPRSSASHYLRYLNLGFHLGPTADQDNHYKNWGTLTDARTGVIAPALTKVDLLHALKARHVFASTDRNLQFLAKVVVNNEEFLMGDIIPPPPPGTEVEIRYVLKDADESNASYKVDVWSDVVGGPDAAKEVLPDARVGDTADGQPERIQGLTYDGERRYYLLKVTQKNEEGDKDTLWTAPVWFEPTAAATPVAAGEVDENKFVASRNSGVFHVSSKCRITKQIKAANRVTGVDAADGRQQHEGCPLE